MNERIQELAEQASFDVGQIMAEILCPDYDGSELYKLIDAYNVLPKEIRSETVEIIRKKQEKFAELIVGECMRMCDVAAVGYETHGHSKEASGCDSAKEYIAEHFGVTE